MGWKPPAAKSGPRRPPVSVPSATALTGKFVAQPPAPEGMLLSAKPPCKAEVTEKPKPNAPKIFNAESVLLERIRRRDSEERTQKVLDEEDAKAAKKAAKPEDSKSETKPDDSKAEVPEAEDPEYPEGSLF